MQDFSHKVGAGNGGRGFATPAHVHMLGIGGIGMAGLARLLKDLGWGVDGCDRLPSSRNAQWLQSHGVEVLAGHDPAHLNRKRGWVFYSSAVDPGEAELRQARSLGIPVLSRGNALALLFNGKTGIAVSGTHGKTTTAGILIRLLHGMGNPVGWCLGGWIAGVDGPAGGGQNDWLVCEADESDGTLAEYQAKVLVLTNIEPDHMENFHDFADLKACFRRAVESAGKVVYCSDDAVAADLCEDLPGALGYGYGSKARLRAEAWREVSGGAIFRVEHDGRPIGEVALRGFGRHNTRNALGALGAVVMAGYAPEKACACLGEAFLLPERRFDVRANRDGVRVVSDYAHHPTEIRALLSMVTGRGVTKVIFQPHRYSRTKALAGDFADSFRGADEVWIVPVFAASQQPVEGGRSCDLHATLRRCDHGIQRLRYARSLTEAWGGMKRNLAKGDSLLVVGAGDVDRVANWAAEFIRRGGTRRAGSVERFAGFEKALCGRGWRGGVVHGAALGASTSLAVGGGCDLLARPRDADDLKLLKDVCRQEGVRILIMGAGTNFLVPDAGIDGVVVRLQADFWKTFRVEGERVWAAAGMPGARFLRHLGEHGLGGLEFMAGIPGTVGGWLAMNAGVHGKSIADAVEGIHGLSDDGREAIIKPSEAGWGYRHCRCLRDHVALGAWFRLRREKPETIRERMHVHLEKRPDLRGVCTAGSVFRNPPGDYAGRILDECGCKGWRVGGAYVYGRHANVICSEKGANASDVLALIDRMRYRAQDCLGITLIPEIICPGADNKSAE